MEEAKLTSSPNTQTPSRTEQEPTQMREAGLEEMCRLG